MDAFHISFFRGLNRVCFSVLPQGSILGPSLFIFIKVNLIEKPLHIAEYICMQVTIVVILSFVRKKIVSNAFQAEGLSIERGVGILKLKLYIKPATSDP